MIVVGRKRRVRIIIIITTITIIISTITNHRHRLCGEFIYNSKKKKKKKSSCYYFGSEENDLISINIRRGLCLLWEALLMYCDFFSSKKSKNKNRRDDKNLITLKSPRDEKK